MSDLDLKVLDAVDLSEEEREGFAFTPTWSIAKSVQALEGVSGMYDYKKSRVLYAEIACGNSTAALYAVDKPVKAEGFGDRRAMHLWRVRFFGSRFHSNETLMYGSARSSEEARRAATLTSLALFRALGVAAPASLSEAEVRMQHKLLTVEKRHRRQGASMLRYALKNSASKQDMLLAATRFATAKDIG